MGDVMSATEAGDLLGAMTPGTLEVAEIRDGKLADAGPQEFAVVIHDDPRAHQKPDGTWHSVIVCRGMDGPSRGSNAAALSSVKQALASVVALHSDLARLRAPADLAAVKARAAAAVDAIIADGSDRRGVLNLYACDDDIRDEIVATWRAAVAREIVAAVVENTGACNSHAVALLAAEREGHAAEVAGARAAALREGFDIARNHRDEGDALIALDAAVAALGTKGGG